MSSIPRINKMQTSSLFGDLPTCSAKKKKKEEEEGDDDDVVDAVDIADSDNNDNLARASSGKETSSTTFTAHTTATIKKSISQTTKNQMLKMQQQQQMMLKAKRNNHSQQQQQQQQQSILKKQQQQQKEKTAMMMMNSNVSQNNDVVRGGQWDCVDEYDPSTPNSYEDEKMKSTREDREKKERDDDAMERKNRISEMHQQMIMMKNKKEKGQEILEIPVAEKGMSLAMKMMMKMGWEKGKGLGKQEQGIDTPLEIQKYDKDAGRIVKSKPLFKARRVIKIEDTSSNKGCDELLEPFDDTVEKTSILMIKNVETSVDENLEDEIAEICETYGSIHRIFLFEVTEINWRNEKTRVCAFVQFLKADDCLQCGLEIHNKIFGGRRIECAFFDEGKFHRKEFAPLRA